MPNDHSGVTNAQSLIDRLKDQIQNLPKESQVRKVGEVLQVADGVALISGLFGAMMGEMLFFLLVQNDAKDIGGAGGF